MTLEIEGLTTRQRKIADILWVLNSPEDVSSFIDSLASPLKEEARTVMNLMIWAMLDTVMDTDLAKRELSRFML